jgi:hypothetical protein
MEVLSDNQTRLLNEVRAQCARRGWFFINATNLQDLNDIIALEKKRLIEVDERDVRIDHVYQRVRAGEFVGKLSQIE